MRREERGKRGVSWKGRMRREEGGESEERGKRGVSWNGGMRREDRVKRER